MYFAAKDKAHYANFMSFVRQGSTVHPPPSPLTPQLDESPEFGAYFYKLNRRGEWQKRFFSLREGYLLYHDTHSVRMLRRRRDDVGSVYAAQVCAAAERLHDREQGVARVAARSSRESCARGSVILVRIPATEEYAEGVFQMRMIDQRFSDWWCDVLTNSASGMDPDVRRP